MTYKSYYESPVGMIMLESDGTYLTALAIEGQYHFKKNQSQLENENIFIFQKAKKWLEEYFQQKNPPIKDLPIKFSGSEFQEKVWKHLLEIPYGQVVTYKEIAKKVAQDLGKEKMSAQAVGGAVGKNPLSIIIPCHRVIGKDCERSDYGGGLDIHINLVEIEGVDTTKYHLPKR